MMVEPVPTRENAARLRVYIGAAAGVGKTYRMLEHAHLLRKQGEDVVIGLIEAHGRKETEAMLGDLEVIPQKVIEYKSVRLREMDLDGIIARRPGTVVVDELAHSHRVHRAKQRRQRLLASARHRSVRCGGDHHQCC